ncbi:MAG: acetylornithine/succinyldiaminopimelate/putrescine aminotransferase [Pseudohongiellaceae bacterium]
MSHLTENNVSEKVARKGQIIAASLRGLAEKYPDLIKEVGGRGLLWATQLYEQSQVTHLTEIAMQKGLLVVPTRNSVVRLIPPLVISEGELIDGLSSLDCALRELYLQAAGRHMNALSSSADVR